MTAATPRARHPRLLILAFCAALLALLAAPCAQAQTTSVTDGSTPSALTPGAPAGSYPLSDFESINLYNGNLNFALPLLRVGGRGAVDASVTLKIERHWRVKTLKPLPNCQITGISCNPTYFPDPNGWISTPDYGPGSLVGRQPGSECGGGQGLGLTRLTFTAGDGTEYELRDRDYGGQPKYYPCSAETGHLRGVVFVTADGTAASFVSDAPIYDSSSTAPRTIRPFGVLKLRDGTIYRIDDGRVMWVRDRNGNRVSYTYEGPKVKTVTDTLGRTVTFNYSVSDVAPYGLCDQIVYKGFGGADRIVRVSRTNLGNVLRTTRAEDPALPKKVSELFPEFESSANLDFNPAGVVSAVWLPDDGVNHRAYKFFYNVYGELARVELPTGGAVEYDFAKYSVTNDGIFRGVAERRVYADGVNLEGQVAYSIEASPRTVEGYDAGGTLLTRSKHYFHGNPLDSLAQFPTDYSGWREGREYKTEHFGVTNGVASAEPLRRVEKVWQQRALVSWWTGTAEREPANDPRIVEIVTTVEPGGANLVTKHSALNPQTGAVGFDQFNNPTDLWEYDYGQGAVPARALRHAHTDYLTTNNGVDYTSASGTHLRSLPAGQQIYGVNPSTGAETLVAKSETRYDEAAYAPLTCGTAETPTPCSSAQQWDDPGAAPRGNVTTIRSWLDTTNSWLETHAQYDQLGNVRYSWDAKGNLSEVSYLDSFCNDGNGCGTASSVPHTFAFPTATKSPKPDPSGAYGSAAELMTSTVYDFYTGLAYSSTDANNQTTRMEYADPLDRPTAEVRPDGGRTDIEYSQPNEPLLYVRTLADLDGARRLKAEQHFDKMGRPSRSFTWENQDQSNPWLTVDTLYDALGQAWRVSNPYRSTGPGSAVDVNRAGAETSFDALGRVRQVKTADGASVTTSYVGNEVTVTDQAGKQRSSVSDALGRLTDIYEDPDPGGLNYRTSYQYDALGNLRTVMQGAQTRIFVYDSLGRLTSATNPEACRQEGAQCVAVPTSYEYYADGSLKTRTDARGVQTNYEYDGLGRVKSRSYVTPELLPATPTMTYRYDGAGVTGGVPNSKGRLTEVGSSVSTYSYGAYDVMGRVKSSSQTTAGQTYAMSYDYDLAGNLKEETYPSGRKVATGFDAAGRISSVTGVRAGEADRTYASQIAYAPHGVAAQLRLGNGLWEHTLYNNRLQPREIGLGATATDSGLLKLEYAYAASLDPASDPITGELDLTKNNGDVRVQRISVPAAGQTAAQTFTQTYGYDRLDRLESAEEKGGAASNWKQVYSYDRYGNRTFTNGTTYPAQLNTINNPVVSEANNRITSTGYVYDEAGNLRCDALHPCTGDGTNTAYYDYDGEGRMVRAGSGGSDYSNGGNSYAYDGDGRRVKKATYDGEATVFVYDAGGRVVAEYSNQVAYKGTRYLTQDHLGSTRAVTDAQGNAHSEGGAGGSRHDYLPFGEELSASVGVRTTAQGYGEAYNVSQQFTGKERDKETSLDYFGARYYSSSGGRFTGVDMAGPDLHGPQTLNKYQYCLNNPLRFVDRNGLYEKDVHFDLTKVLAYAAGFSMEESTAIATADQNVDDDPATNPTNLDNMFTWEGVRIRAAWHFTTAGRRNNLWRNFETLAGQSESSGGVGDPSTRGRALDALGRFFHPQQDSYSHAEYGPVLGHSFHGHAPDQTYNDPIKAFLMGYNTFQLLVRAANRLGGTSRPVPFGLIGTKVMQFSWATTNREKQMYLGQMIWMINWWRRLQERPIQPEKVEVAKSLFLK